MKPFAVRPTTIFLLAQLLSATAAHGQWQAVDPARVLVIETTQGRVLVEMRPDVAPQSVARVVMLAREGVYDGLQFHRVVPHFVVQTGNPNNRDGGVSAHPNLPAEFTFRLRPESAEVTATHASDTRSGFLGSVPFESAIVDPSRRVDGMLRAWGAYCPGVAGMGRQAAPDSANSEIFFMLEASRTLDRDYTVWGRIVDGFAVLQSLAAGNPPAKPDLMTTVRVLADVPAADRVRVSLPGPKEMATLIDQVRTSKGADFSICDVTVPAQITPP